MGIEINWGKHFKALRLTKKLSVYKLSKISNVSENYIRTIEKGDGQPSVFIIERLLNCLGITLSEFFNESDSAVLYPTKFEQELIEKVRLLDEEKALAVLNMVHLLAK